MRRIVKRRITVPDAPALGTITVVSSSALTVPLARAATGPTRLDEYILERSSGGTFAIIATGIDIFGASAAYQDTGLAANQQYFYRTDCARAAGSIRW